MQTSGKTLTALCAFSMLAGMAQANLITNPGFETPIVATGTFQTFGTGSVLIPGWTVTGAPGTDVAIVNTTFAQGGVTFQALEGNQWLDLTGLNSNSTEGIRQTVATTPAANYVLSFFIGNTTGGGIFGTSSTAALKINGAQVNTFTNSTVSPTNLNWTKFTVAFVATTALTTIEFDNADPGSDNSNGLDLVDLEPAAASTVPEPASMALFSSALAVIALRVRHRRT